MELFSGSEVIIRFFISLSLVVLVIFLCAWLSKAYGLSMPTFLKKEGSRLKIIEVLMIDTKHKLVLIKRDNVEHLLCLGGTQNMVIEQNIAVNKYVLPSHKIHNAPILKEVK